MLYHNPYTSSKSLQTSANPAAQFAQELLSTFSTALGEVALQPTTGGVFRVELVVPLSTSTSDITTAASSFHSRSLLSPPVSTRTHILWDRKTEGGFPETKELKRRLRDVVDPARDLGHVDRDYPRPQSTAAAMPDAAATSDKAKEGAAADDAAASKPMLPHGRGAHTKMPPISATDEVRERLEAKHRAKEEEARASEQAKGQGTTEEGKDCADCA